MNLAMALEMSAECFPDRVAVTSNGENMTYGELLAAAKRVAAEIKASGCKYVGLLDISSMAVPIAVFASAYAGIPYVPLNYRLTKPELEELLERIAPAYLVTDTPAISPLKVAEGTVKNHVSNILSKLGVRDRTRAVLKALELGIV